MFLLQSQMHLNFCWSFVHTARRWNVMNVLNTSLWIQCFWAFRTQSTCCFSVQPSNQRLNHRWDKTTSRAPTTAQTCQTDLCLFLSWAVLVLVKNSCSVLLFFFSSWEFLPPKKKKKLGHFYPLAIWRKLSTLLSLPDVCSSLQSRLLLNTHCLWLNLYSGLDFSNKCRLIWINPHEPQRTGLFDRVLLLLL